MPQPPKILGTEEVARSRLFTIERVDLEFSNGATAGFERLASGGTGAVMIIGMTASDEIVLVREYMVGLERYELGFPKGRIDAGESAETAANRELTEEASYRADRLEALGVVSVAPAYAGFQTHLFLATGLTPATAEGDEPEPLEVILWPRTRLRELLDREDFTETRNRLAIYMLLDRAS